MHGEFANWLSDTINDNRRDLNYFARREGFYFPDPDPDPFLMVLVPYQYRTHTVLGVNLDFAFFGLFTT